MEGQWKDQGWILEGVVMDSYYLHAALSFQSPSSLLPHWSHTGVTLDSLSDT